MTKKIVDPGYRLPDGDLTEYDLNCMILFYPDEDEYRRALWGSLEYLGTWKAWERDTAKRGKDAATAWKDANDCTWECFIMGCLDQLTSDVSDIKALLAGLDPCCGQTTTIGPQEEVETEIEPGVGDPPDYYGETAITDWDDWAEHVCYNAHLWVDNLVSTAQSLDSASQNGLLTLTLIGAALALLSFSGIGIPIAISLAIAVLTGATAAGSLIYSTTADDLEDARDDLVCALLNGDDIRDVVRDALGVASLDWTSTFQYVDYESATSIIYEGGANGEYLPTETRDDCDCEEPYLFLWDFDTDLEGWPTGQPLSIEWLSSSVMQGNCNSTGVWRSCPSETGNDILTRFSESGSQITVEKMAVRCRFYTPGTPIYWEMKFAAVDGTDTAFYSDTYDSTTEGSNVWFEKEFTFSSPIDVRMAGTALNLSAYRSSSASGGQRVQFDWVKIYGSIT